MARFRLVAIDLDGTLLDSHRSVPEVNRTALERAQGKGVKLAVVTGRRLPSARPYLSHLRLDLLMVLNGGALIQRGLDGPVLERKLIPLAVSQEVLRLASQMRAVPVVDDGSDGEGRLLIESGAPVSPSLEAYLDKTTPPPFRVSHLAAALEKNPLQIMFAGSISRMRATADGLQEKLGSRLALALTEYPTSDFAILDVVAAGASKGEALRFLADREGILPGETMAIGDNWNDLGMLEAAGLAVVMGNACPELRSRGFAVTGSNDEGGVAQAIERYVLSES